MTTTFIIPPLEITLPTSDAFLQIRETLQRVGIASFKNKTLWQSCHILFAEHKYYIMHFKELMARDGKSVDIPDSDIRRRNTIARLLQEWGLLTILRPEQFADVVPLGQIKIISFREKQEWICLSKYEIGKLIKH